MKIPLQVADKKVTATSTSHRMGNLGKRSPLRVPVMDATGKAISAAGRVSADISQKMYVAEGQRESLQAYTDMNDGFNQALDEIKKPEYQDMSVTEHEDWFKSRAQGLKDQVLGKMKNHKAREAMTARFDKAASDELVKTQTIGWNREVDRGRATLYSALDKFENAAAGGDFKAIGDAEAAIKGAVDVGYLSKEQGEKALDEFNNRTTMTYWKRQSDDFQEQTFDAVFARSKTKKGFPVRGKQGLYVVKDKLPESFGNLDEEQKRQTLEYIKKGWENYHSRWSWGLRKRKILLNDDIKNDLARIKETGAGDGQIMDKIRVAYADDIDTMEQVLELHKRNQALASTTYKYTDQIMKADPAEQAEIMANLGAHTDVDAQGNPVPGKPKDPYVKGLTDWRRVALITDLEQVAYKKAQALEKDPAKYVMSTFSQEIAMLPPEQRANFIMMEQVKLGVPEHAVRMLTDVQADTIVGTLEQQAGEAKVKALQELQAGFTPQQYKVVYRDLVKSGLPIGTQFLISQDAPSQAVVRQKYGEVLNIKDKELKDALGSRAKEVEQDFETAFEKAFSDYRDSVINQGGGGMDNTVLLGIRSVIKKAVMFDARNEEANVKELTQMYVEKSFNELYNFQNGYRVPKVHNPDNIDTFTTYVNDNLSDYPIIAPASMNPELDPDFILQTYIENIRTQGKWVNIPDGSGLRLVDQNNQPVLVKGNSPGEARMLEIPFGVADEAGAVISEANRPKLKPGSVADNLYDVVWTDGLAKTGRFAGSVAGEFARQVAKHRLPDKVENRFAPKMGPIYERAYREATK